MLARLSCLLKGAGELERERDSDARNEAIERLQSSPHPFAVPVSWGMDLQAEHERYLAEELVGGPLFVTNYPASLKP